MGLGRVLDCESHDLEFVFGVGRLRHSRWAFEDGRGAHAQYLWEGGEQRGCCASQNLGEGCIPPVALAP